MSQFIEVFVMLKPDATMRFGVAESIVNHLVVCGYKILETDRRDSLLRFSAEHLYNEHKDKPHFKDLIDYTCSGPVVLMRVGIPDDHPYLAHHLSNPVDARYDAAKDMDLVERFKVYVVGDSNPEKRMPGTLRDYYAISRRANSVHCSDNQQRANYELGYYLNSNYWDKYNDA